MGDSQDEMNAAALLSLNRQMSALAEAMGRSAAASFPVMLDCVRDLVAAAARAERAEADKEQVLRTLDTVRAQWQRDLDAARAALAEATAMLQRWPMPSRSSASPAPRWRRSVSRARPSPCSSAAPAPNSKTPGPPFREIRASSGFGYIRASTVLRQSEAMSSRDPRKTSRSTREEPRVPSG